MKIHEKKISFLNEALRVSGYPQRSEFFTTDHTAEKRAVNLGHAENGSGHDCFLNGISVFLDIEAPQYWWMQFRKISGVDTMKKSHNDYWCNPQIELALREGCDIVEVDVISSFFRPLVSHSWRPLRRMCFGDLESYLKKAAQYLCRVQIDLKTGSRIVGKKIMKLVQEYPYTVYITGKDNLFSKGREKLRDEILAKTKAQPMPDNVQSVDLYKKPEKWWWQ